MKSREEILAASDAPASCEAVDIPEWGGDVYVKRMGAKERYQAEQGWRKLGLPEGDNSSLPSWFVVRTVVNPDDGTRVFTDDDYKSLDNHQADVISKLFSKCCELNHLTKSDQEELKKN